MEYLNIDKYRSLYGEITAPEFARLEMAARRKLDNLTTGIDGVKKLQIAFPTNEEDVEIVRHCMAALVSLMRTAEHSQKAAQEIVTTENGMHSNVITSISAGSESIHYASIGSATSAAEYEAMYIRTVKDFLSGIKDANGVNLLYLGRYPYTVHTTK